MFNKKFSHFRQFDQMDCGPACVRMLAKHYGKDYPLSYLRTLSYLTREGVSVAGIRNALTQIGMKSASFNVPLEQLRKKCLLPAILHWNQNHFVVLYDVKWNKWHKEWYYSVADPAFGKHTYSEIEFSQYWINGDTGILIATEPTEDFYTKPPIKEKHSLIHFAQKYIWPFKHEMVQLSLGLLSGIILSLVTPFLTQAMVDDGIEQHNMGIITAILLTQLFLFFGSFTMELISNWVTLYMTTRININILNDYLSKLLKLPMTFFETKSVGDYHQRIGDHSRLQKFTTQATLQTLFSFVTGIFLLVVIGYYSIYILLLYLILTGASTLWMSYFWKKRKSLDYETFKVSSKNHTKLYEMLNGIVDIKLNTYGDFKIKEWHGMQEEQFKISQKSLRLGQIQNTGYSLIGQIRNLVVTFWIASEVVKGNLTLGMMMSISNIIGQINGPLSQLIGFLQGFQDAKISLERSEEVYLCNDEDDKQLENIPADTPQDIIINHLTFRYTGSFGKVVLDDISFTIPAGKMTAIVGESGSGKTTLMKLLLKFYSPCKGQIMLGENNLEKYKAESIRQSTGIVMQDNFIFSDTIMNNIIFGEEYDEERLQHALKMACLNNYIANLPLGIHTRIGADGNGVSGGEKQRIMIARAIYKQPLYMMLDEATSSLDAENERLITDNINECFKNRTLIVIAHRLSTVKNADNIIVLRHGKVVECGVHSYLVNKKGYYYELVKNQLDLAKE